MFRRRDASWDEIASAERLQREQRERVARDRKRQEAQARREHEEIVAPLRGLLARNHFAELFEAAMRGLDERHD